MDRRGNKEHLKAQTKGSYTKGSRTIDNTPAIKGQKEFDCGARNEPLRETATARNASSS